MSDKPTLWILGAGFSRSLGGPLLSDLLSMASRARHCAKDPSLSRNSSYNQAYALYQYGRGLPEEYLFDPGLQPPRGARLWADAEEFLETVSNAPIDASGAAKFLQENWHNVRTQCCSLPYVGDKYLKIAGMDSVDLDVAQLQKAVVNLLALECNFVADSRPENLDQWERAQPYIAWGKCLDGNDTIITFNYDTVIEEIAVPGIRVFGVQRHDSEGAPFPTAPTLIKLHGSIDWIIHGEKYVRQPGSIADPPSIAGPGNAKLEAQRGGFRPMWDEARKKLENAGRVIWIGYGMPSSDAAAVELLLGAVAANHQPDLCIDIILGNPGFHTERIEAMLKGLVRGNELGHYLEKAQQLEECADDLEQDPEFARGGRVASGELRVGDVEEADRLRQHYNQRLAHANSVLSWHSSADPTKGVSPRVLPLYAQDFLRLYATEKEQDIYADRLSNRTTTATERIHQMIGDVDEQ